MSPRDEMLRCMKNRAEGLLIAGQPVIPDGPVATTGDMQEFKRLVQALGYAVKFGQTAAVTRPGPRLVAVTAGCTVGVLSDEYFHVWNNFAETRGKYLETASRRDEHQALGSTLRLSGSSNDRRFHQLELLNYVQFLEKSGGPIPIFVWRTFNLLKRGMKARAGG